MLDISSTLLDKVKEKLQTIGNNANPRMEIIAQKAAKYLNQGSFLVPRTVRTGDSLGALDICIRRENFMAEPTEIVMVYVENYEAKVATLAYACKPTENFKYSYTIGPATDVACDFDGRWNFISDHSGLYFDTDTVWALETFGEPYIAIVTSAGRLTIYQNRQSVVTLQTDNVSKCSILRGWKSVSEILTDQGVICAYTKTDGKAYYRNYCEQEDGTYIWEIEREITELVAPISNISLFRCADYRTGFLVDSSGEIKVIVTNRSWSGMAILPDHIKTEIVGAVIDVIEIGYYDYKCQDEYIISSNFEATILNFGDIMPTIRDAWNYVDGFGDFGKFVMVRWSDTISGIETNKESFKMVDAYNVSYYPSSIHKTGYNNRMILEFEDFNNAGNPVSIVYTPGTLVWLDNASVSASEVEFNAEGLVPTFIPAPVVTNIDSTNNRTIVLTFDRPIITIDSGVGFSISGNEPIASPAGELIPSTYVVDSVAMADIMTYYTDDLDSGTMNNVSNNSGIIKLADEEV